jgi:hypothetical protein
VLLLCSLTTLAGPSCIVADPPEYTDRESTRPHVLVQLSSPSTLYPIRVQRPGSQQFSIRIQSEDAGEDLLLAFFIDYGRPGAFYYEDYPVPATTQLEKTPTFSFVANNLLTDGCHTLTMLAMHESSWDAGANQPYPSRLDDVSHTHWVLYVNVPDGVVPRCPGPEGVSPP